jgi:arylsulfatase A-like enzyme
MVTARRLAGPLALALLASCRASPEPRPSVRELRPLRGIVLVSIDALRADTLGLYGSPRPTSPFLDALAARRAVVFEHAFSQIASTLPSHLSMFTGLYPSEHGVEPPRGLLAEEIPTLPELFRAAGFRTFGHSEAGYVQGKSFRRGFDEWSATPYTSDLDLERTLGRGIASLARLAPEERFFLFLHSYTVHDPYDPPAELAARFWDGPPPAGAFPATGPNFAAHNGGKLDAPPDAARYYRALYEAGVAYVDQALARFFAELERLGLAEDTLVAVTSDHGEEFRDHGRYAHTQAYPETLRIPLVVVDPRLAAGRRVERVVETIDFLPTFAELTGWEPPAGVTGESFADLFAGGDGRLAGRAYGQQTFLGYGIRTLFEPVDGRLHQLCATRAIEERDGFWVTRALRFDATGPALDLRLVAYHRPRTVVVTVDGAVLAELAVGTDWSTHRVELPAGDRHLVTLSAPDCASPLDLGLGEESRCLSFKVQGPPLVRLELFDLVADPLAQHDLSRARPELVRRLVRDLRLYPETARARAEAQALGEEQIRQLKALGYLQ